MRRRQFSDARWQFLRRQLAQMILDGWSPIGGRGGNFYSFGAETNCADGIRFEANRLAAKKNLRSRLPDDRSFWLRGELL